MSGSNGHKSPQKQATPRAGKGGIVPPPEHRFKKGESGNPGGLRKGTVSIVRALRKALDESGDEGEALAIVQSAIESAKSGSFQHFKEIIDRIDGKVADKSETDGKLEIIVRYVDRPGPAHDNAHD